MARTGQAFINEKSVHHFKDHKDDTYVVVRGRPDFCEDIDIIRKLGIHLYCLDHLETSPEAIGEALSTIDIFGLDYQPRIDIYTSCTTIEQCIAHHLREKHHRADATEDFRRAATKGMTDEQAHEHLITKIRGSQPLPHIVPTWCESPTFYTEPSWLRDTSTRYRSWILVLKEGIKSFNDILEQGITLVEFDLWWTSEMEITLMEYESSQIPSDEEDPWTLVEIVPRPPEIKKTLLCVRPQPNIVVDESNNWVNADGSVDLEKFNEYQHGWKTPGAQNTLRDQWSHTLTRQLFDCTYRNVYCEGCRPAKGGRKGNIHMKEECEWELDEHFFDEDGRCVECRREEENQKRMGLVNVE